MTFSHTNYFRFRSRWGAVAGPRRVEDQAMSSARELIEHGFALADALWPWMSDASSMKVGSGMPLQEIYFCKMYFTNLYLCLNHGLTTTRTGVKPPALESYVRGDLHIAVLED